MLDRADRAERLAQLSAQRMSTSVSRVAFLCEGVCRGVLDHLGLARALVVRSDGAHALGDLLRQAAHSGLGFALEHRRPLVDLDRFADVERRFRSKASAVRIDNRVRNDRQISQARAQRNPRRTRPQRKQRQLLMHVPFGVDGDLRALGERVVTGLEGLHVELRVFARAAPMDRQDATEREQEPRRSELPPRRGGEEPREARRLRDDDE